MAPIHGDSVVEPKILEFKEELNLKYIWCHVSNIFKTVIVTRIATDFRDVHHFFKVNLKWR